MHTPPKLRGKACASERILYLFRGKAWDFPVSTCRGEKWGNSGFSNPLRMTSAHASARFFSCRRCEICRNKKEILSVSCILKQNGDLIEKLGVAKRRNRWSFQNPPKRCTHERTLFGRASTSIRNETYASAEGASGKNLIFEPEILFKMEEIRLSCAKSGESWPPLRQF